MDDLLVFLAPLFLLNYFLFNLFFIFAKKWGRFNSPPSPFLCAVPAQTGKYRRILPSRHESKVAELEFPPCIKETIKSFELHIISTFLVISFGKMFCFTGDKHTLVTPLPDLFN